MKVLVNYRTRTLALCLGIVLLLIMVAMLTGCGGTPQEANDTMGTPPAATVEWTPETDCLTCHTAQDPGTEDPTAPAVLHAANGADCITCHDDAAGLATVHEGATADAKMPQRLRTTKVDEALCLSCHNKDELAAVTAESTVLTDKNGLTINPHDLPTVGAHSSITCTNCHVAHESSAGLSANAMANCTKCHHEEVFECNTCHEA